MMNDNIVLVAPRPVRAEPLIPQHLVARRAPQPPPQVLSPPPQPPVSVPAAPSPELAELRALVQDQKRAIEGLESEKVSLTATLDRLSLAEHSTSSSSPRALCPFLRCPWPEC